VLEQNDKDIIIPTANTKQNTVFFILLSLLIQNGFLVARLIYKRDKSGIDTVA